MRLGGSAKARPGLVVAGLLAGALLGGCRSGPRLPEDLARAQAAERQPDPAAALAAYEELYEGCRRGTPAPSLSAAKDDCGGVALRRAQHLEQLGRSAEAVQAFLDVRSVSTDGRTIARALVRAAQLLSDQPGGHDEALKLCREVIPRWPDEVAAEDALRLLVRLQRDEPQLPAELDALAEKLRRHEVLASFALLEAGRWYEGHAEPAQALARYDTLAQRYPRGPLLDDGLWAAAQVLRKQQRFAEAAQRLERLQQTFRSSILVGHYNLQLLDDSALLLGQIYLRELRQPQRAKDTLAGFLKRQPNSLLADDALVLMAEATSLRATPPSAGDRAEACALLDRLARDYPDSNQQRRAAALRAQLACATQESGSAPP